MDVEHGGAVDLVVDLNTMDETGMPWAFLQEAPNPDRVVPGAYVVAGSGSSGCARRRHRRRDRACPADAWLRCQQSAAPHYSSHRAVRPGEEMVACDAARALLAAETTWL